jgi:hypothetical protein
MVEANSKSETIAILFCLNLVFVDLRPRDAGLTAAASSWRCCRRSRTPTGG